MARHGLKLGLRSNFVGLRGGTLRFLVFEVRLRFMGLHKKGFVEPGDWHLEKSVANVNVFHRMSHPDMQSDTPKGCHGLPHLFQV